MTRLKLHTSREAFERLHQQADKVRRKSAPVKVPRDDFMNLLMDHSRMLARLNNEAMED